MGLSSVRAVAFIESFSIGRPFDTKIITAGIGVPHVYIGQIAILEQPLELGLDQAIGNVTLSNQPPAARISVEREAVGKHVDREPRILPISLAVVLVDENGAGQRKVFPSIERIVREQNPAFFANVEGSEALAAAPV